MIEAIVITVLVGAIWTAVPWSPSMRIRRRTAATISLVYLVSVIAYLVVTLSIHGWSAR